MKNTKPYILLTAIKPHEFPLLEKFVNSSYFNNKEEIRKLLEFLLKILREEEETFESNSEAAFTYIFPEVLFEPDRIRHLTSELNFLIQKFLINLELRQNLVLEKRLLIHSLNKRNLSKLFVDESKKLILQLNKSKTQDINTLLDSYFLSQELYFSPTSIKDSNDINHLAEAQKKLDSFYLLSKLKLSCEVFGRRNTYNKSFDIPLYNEVLSLSKEWDKKNELFNLYLQVLQNIQNKSDANAFKNLKNQFFKNVKQLSKKESHTLFLLILNINGNLINYGESEGIKIQLELYKKGLKQNILLNNNIITPESFTNIIVLGVQQKEYKWTESFIGNYSKYLQKSVYQQCYNFSQGYLAYGKGDYEEATLQLWNCKFNQLSFDVRTKSIIARAVVEQFFRNPDKYEFCLGQIHTVERYIRRKKDLVEIKSRAYLNFIKFTKKIVMLRRKGKLHLTEIEKLKNKINLESYCIGKAWLNEKLTVENMLIEYDDLE